MRALDTVVRMGATVAALVGAGCSGQVSVGGNTPGAEDSGQRQSSGVPQGQDADSVGSPVGEDASFAGDVVPDGNAPGSSAVSVPLAGSGSPATAADGWILFDSDVVGLVRHVFAVRADGTGLVELTSGASNDSEPVASPDGSTLVFTSDRAGSPQLFAMNVATKAVQPLGTPGGSGQAAFSPDGSTIAFHANYVVYVMGADGSAQRQVVVSQGQSSGVDYQHAVFMPGGSELLVERCNLLDVFDLSGQKLRGLVEGWSQESQWPAIQRGGVNVAFVTSCPNLDDSIVVMPLSGYVTGVAGNCSIRAGSARDLGALSHPSWGPGTLIAFSHMSAAGVRRVVVGDAANPTAAAVEIAQDSGDQQDPSWAPSTFQP